MRDLSSVVSNYRSKLSLDEYLQKEGVLGIANVDTRAITRRLRETGCLNGVITSDLSIPTDQLVEQAKQYSIVGVDLISQVGFLLDNGQSNETVHPCLVAAPLQIVHVQHCSLCIYVNMRSQDGSGCLDAVTILDCPSATSI